MGFTEAAHDDGKLSGRGFPWKRGLASGVMTAIGGLGHFIELWVIAWIQNRYMETPFLRAAFQVSCSVADLCSRPAFLIGGA